MAVEEGAAGGRNVDKSRNQRPYQNLPESVRTQSLLDRGGAGWGPSFSGVPPYRIAAHQLTCPRRAALHAHSVRLPGRAAGRWPYACRLTARP